MQSELPDGWAKASLGSISEIRRGASPRPIKDPKWFAADGPGWVRISDVTASRKYLRRTTQSLSAEGVARSVSVFPGDLIMSICATIGRPIIIDMNACIHDGFVLFDLSESVERDFLYSFLQYKAAEFAGQGQPGTQKNLNTGIVKAVGLALPPLPEQRKIAEILSSVDEAIQATQAVIEQTRRVKEGLLQELLTKGIGHTRFKKTAIGEIPESWEVKPVRELFHTQLGKMMSKQARSGPNQKPYLRNINVRWRHFELNDLDTIHFDSREMQKFALQSGDILMCEGRALGRSAIWSGEVEECFYQKALHRLRSRSGEMLPEFFADYIYYAFKVADLFAGDRLESTIPHLTKERLERLLIPVPPLLEQVRINSVLEGFWQRVNDGEAELGQLNQAKAGLLQDLLTGRVRVSV